MNVQVCIIKLFFFYVLVCGQGWTTTSWLLNLIYTPQTSATNAHNVFTCHTGTFWLHFFYNRRRLRRTVHLYLHSTVAVLKADLVVLRRVVCFWTQLSQFMILPPERLYQMRMFSIPDLQSVVGMVKQEPPSWEPEVLLDICPHSQTSRRLCGCSGACGGSGWRRHMGLLHMGQTLRISNHLSKHFL